MSTKQTISFSKLPTRVHTRIHTIATLTTTQLLQAKEIVNRNGLGDRVTVIRGKIEEIHLPVEKVDINNVIIL